MVISETMLNTTLKRGHKKLATPILMVGPKIKRKKWKNGPHSVKRTKTTPKKNTIPPASRKSKALATKRFKVLVAEEVVVVCSAF